VKLVTIYIVRNAMELALVRCALEGSDVPHHVDGENFAGLSGYVFASRVMVPEEFQEEALELLADVGLAVADGEETDSEDTWDDE